MEERKEGLDGIQEERIGWKKEKKDWMEERKEGLCGIKDGKIGWNKGRKE